jgi:signal transduction histidine kinase
MLLFSIKWQEKPGRGRLAAILAAVAVKDDSGAALSQTRRMKRSALVLLGLAAAGVAATGIARSARRVQQAEREIAELRRVQAAHALRASRLDHEFRTPIGAAAAALELLEIAGIGDAALQAEARQVIARQLNRMTALTETLREFARDPVR